MLYIDRSKSPVPPSLLSANVLREMERAKRYFETRVSTQTRFDFNEEPYHAGDVMKSLFGLFHSKCAYCETPLTSDTADVDHFRPRFRSMNLDGSVSPKHYWWLAYSWENLVLSCVYCNRIKAHRFPVEGKRLDPLQYDVSKERNDLLDPGRDIAAKHLIFTDDGLALGQTERGKVTVELLNLNRPDVIEKRRNRVMTFKEELLRTGQTDGIGDFIRAQAPYAAACVSVLARFLKSHPEYVLDARNLPAANDVLATLQEVGGVDERQLVHDYRRRQSVQAAYSVEAANHTADRTSYFSAAKRIESISLLNFKGISRLKITFPPPGKAQESWVMLLGENGTGKSTVLQAVALALMGEAHSNSLGLDASKFVRRGQPDAGVAVQLSGLEQPVLLMATATSSEFRVEPKEPKVLLMGYGATRLLPAATRAASRRRYVRIENLFDPTAPLNDAERWLSDVSDLDEDQFQLVAAALKDLLMLGDEDHFYRSRGQVYAHVMGAELALRQLSDGLQSVLALATDIVIATHEHWPSMQDAEGIVLLDEIEVHLHPSWKLQIVQRLRRTFPRLNFLVTTHDPLCLRGLEDGEIALLRRNRNREIEVVTDVPSVAHLRADQILTSFLFSLPSTRSDDSSAMVSRYSALLGKAAKSPREEQELKDLETVLRDMLLAGETPLQRKVEQAVKKAYIELAREQQSQPIAMPVMTPDVEFEIRRQLTELVKGTESNP
jgi:uncharacterized protein (TIGR02646 family)